MEYTLSLTFTCSNGDKTTLSIDGVRKDITDEETSAVMDAIIAKNIFKTSNGELVGKYSAQLTEKQVVKLDIL